MDTHNISSHIDISGRLHHTTHLVYALPQFKSYILEFKGYLDYIDATYIHSFRTGIKNNYVKLKIVTKNLRGKAKGMSNAARHWYHNDKKVKFEKKIVRKTKAQSNKEALQRLIKQLLICDDCLFVILMMKVNAWENYEPYSQC